MAQEVIKFTRGDMFFEPVMAFFNGYVGYLAIANGMAIGDRIEGRFRGGVVKQVAFELGTFLLETFRGQSRDEIVFTVDNVETQIQGMTKVRQVEVRTFENYWCQ